MFSEEQVQACSLLFLVWMVSDRSAACRPIAISVGVKLMMILAHSKLISIAEIPIEGNH